MTPEGKITDKEIKHWRFVIAEIKSSQNPSKQIPLPTGINSIQVRKPGFEVDKPLVVPFAIMQNAANSYSDGWVRNKHTNYLDFRGDTYDFRVMELPDEFQTIQGVREMIKELNAGHAPVAPPEGVNWDISNVEWGLMDMPMLMHQRDRVLSGKIKGKEVLPILSVASKQKIIKGKNKDFQIGLEAAEDGCPRKTPDTVENPEEWMKGYDSFSIPESEDV